MEFLHHTELIIYPLMFGYIIYQLALINQKLTTAEKIRELQRKAVNTENVNMAKTMLLFSKWVDSEFDSFANTINSSMGKKVIVRKRDDHKTEVLDELGKLMKEKVSDINTETEL